jgi:hypothetical protein
MLSEIDLGKATSLDGESLGVEILSEIDRCPTKARAIEPLGVTTLSGIALVSTSTRVTRSEAAAMASETVR